MGKRACRARRSEMDNPILRNGPDKRVPPRSGPDKQVPTRSGIGLARSSCPMTLTNKTRVPCVAGSLARFWESGYAFRCLEQPCDLGVVKNCLEAEVAKRDNHYEAAFESYLRTAGIPYVAVDEARRAVMADGRSLKSLDFLVAPPGPVTWLVDVKGRRFPSGLEHHQYWKNWSTQDDLESLSEWEILFGQGFRGLFVFAFHVIGRRLPVDPEWLITFRGERYAFLGVELAHYRQMCYLISPQWQTVAVAARRFREVARPIQAIFSAGVQPPSPVLCDGISNEMMKPLGSSGF